jgi:hypothetical protein
VQASEKDDLAEKIKAAERMLKMKNGEAVNQTTSQSKSPADRCQVLFSSLACSRRSRAGGCRRGLQIAQ